MVTITVDGFDDLVNETNEWMSILHSHFVGNTGLYGGGLAVSILYSPSSNDLFHLNALVNTVDVKTLLLQAMLPCLDQLCMLLILS